MKVKRTYDVIEVDEKNFVEFEGKKIYLVNDAFAVNDAMSDCGYRYDANGVDKFGNEYRIVWEVTNPEATEEENQCDWDEYTVTLQNEYVNLFGTNRNDLENRLANLELGFFEDAETLTDEELEKLIDELEDADIDLEKESGAAILKQIVSKYAK